MQAQRLWENTAEEIWKKNHRHGPLGGADLRFSCPQSDTSLHCGITDLGLVHRMVCLFTRQPSLVLILPPLRDGDWPGLLLTLVVGDCLDWISSDKYRANIAVWQQA